MRGWKGLFSAFQTLTTCLLGYIHKPLLRQNPRKRIQTDNTMSFVDNYITDFVCVPTATVRSHKPASLNAVISFGTTSKASPTIP